MRPALTTSDTYIYIPFVCIMNLHEFTIFHPSISIIHPPQLITSIPFSPIPKPNPSLPPPSPKLTLYVLFTPQKKATTCPVLFGVTKSLLLMVQKSCTSWLVGYPMVYKGFLHPRWCLARFLPPSTGIHPTHHPSPITQPSNHLTIIFRIEGIILQVPHPSPNHHPTI